MRSSRRLPTLRIVGTGQALTWTASSSRPDIMPPLTAGVFPSTETAGRQFDINGESAYRYTSGSLTIQQVPEPATVGLFGCWPGSAQGHPTTRFEVALR